MNQSHSLYGLLTCLLSISTCGNFTGCCQPQLASETMKESKSYIDSRDACLVFLLVAMVTAQIYKFGFMLQAIPVVYGGGVFFPKPLFFYRNLSMCFHNTTSLVSCLCSYVLRFCFQAPHAAFRGARHVLQGRVV